MKIYYIPSKYYLCYVYFTTLNSKYLRPSTDIYTFQKATSGEKRNFTKRFNGDTMTQFNFLKPETYFMYQQL